MTDKFEPSTGRLTKPVRQVMNFNGGIIVVTEDGEMWFMEPSGNKVERIIPEIKEGVYD